MNARLADRSLTLSVSDEVIAHLADQGFDPVYGARPLKRAIQRLIENPLAEALLAGDFLSGDAIKATLSGGELRFVKAPALVDAA